MKGGDYRLEAALDRFKILRNSYGHLPRRGRTLEMLRCFDAAQVEMFQLAQLICALIAPQVQADLDNVRREIMELIELNIKAETGARVVTKKIASSHMVWYEFQLTPEIAVDPTITGNAVLGNLLPRLKAALRQQVTRVNTAVYAMPKK